MCYFVSHKLDPVSPMTKVKKQHSAHLISLIHLTAYFWGKPTHRTLPLWDSTPFPMISPASTPPTTLTSSYLTPLKTKSISTLTTAYSPLRSTICAAAIGLPMVLVAPTGNLTTSTPTTTTNTLTTSSSNATITASPPTITTPMSTLSMEESAAQVHHYSSMLLWLWALTTTILICGEGSLMLLITLTGMGCVFRLEMGKYMILLACWHQEHTEIQQKISGQRIILKWYPTPTMKITLRVPHHTLYSIQGHMRYRIIWVMSLLSIKYTLHLVLLPISAIPT